MDPGVGKIPWRRAWQPTPVFLPGEFHGQRSLAGYSPRGLTESDMTEQTAHARAHYTYREMLVLSKYCCGVGRLKKEKM